MDATGAIGVGATALGAVTVGTDAAGVVVTGPTVVVGIAAGVAAEGSALAWFRKAARAISEAARIPSSLASWSKFLIGASGVGGTTNSPEESTVNGPSDMFLTVAGAKGAGAPGNAEGV